MNLRENVKVAIDMMNYWLAQREAIIDMPFDDWYPVSQYVVANYTRWAIAYETLFDMMIQENPMCTIANCTNPQTDWDIYCEDHTYITSDKMIWSKGSEVWA